MNVFLSWNLNNIMMKYLFLLTVGALQVSFAIGQTVEFFPGEIRGLDRAFQITGNAGESTNVKLLGLHNRSGQTIRIFARPHMEDGDLYFFDGQKTIHETSLQLAPGGRGTIQVFGRMESTTARTCTGYVAMAVTTLGPDGQPGKKKTVKLPVAVKFKGNTVLPGKPSAKPPVKTTTKPAGKPTTKPAETPASRNWTRPERYDVVMQGALPMRWHLRHLPLKVYSKHSNTGDTATQYDAVVRRAVEVWNTAGRETGLGRDFFKVVQNSSQADIRIDWTGRKLIHGANGTAFPSEGRVGMKPLGQYGGIGKAGITLLEELCHMLGVGHSEIRADIMFGGGHSYSPELSKLKVTSRDKQMLGWLYSQTKYVPLRD